MTCKRITEWERSGQTQKAFCAQRDVIRGQCRVLCYRNYGLDIVGRLRGSGFRDARVQPDRAAWWGLGTKVVVAEA